MASVAETVKKYGKAAIGFLATVAAALNEALVLLPDPYQHYATVVLAVLAAVGIWHAPYRPSTRKRRSVKRSGHRKPVPNPHPQTLPNVPPQD